MAKYSQSNNSLFLNLYVEQGQQNIASNSTTVNWRLTVSRTGAYYTFNHQGDSSLSLTLDGRQVHSSNPRWQTSGEEFGLASGSTSVSHNADGTKSFGVSATFNPNNGIHGTITVSANISLTTIPRASSVSVGDGVIGSAVTISINRQNNSFTHTLRYAWGSKSGTIASNVGASHSWTIPRDFANDIPNATSGTGTLYVDTYSGSIKTGTQQVNFTASVPASVKPRFSGVTLTDGNTAARSLLSGNNFLQIISDIQVTFNGAVGSYGSSITGYHAEIVNKNQSTSSNGGRLGMMNFSGSATIRASVIDSRGRRSDTRDITINVIEYFSPILSFSAVRTRETPNIIQIVRNAKIAPITLSGSQKNVMTLTFKVAPLGSTSYTADNGSAAGTFTTLSTLTNSSANLSRNYAANRSFVVIGMLSDKFTRVEFSATVATESVVMSYGKDGRVGIGKIVEQGKAGSLDVAGEIFSGDNIWGRNKTPIGHYSRGRAVADLDTLFLAGIHTFSNSTRNQPFGASAWGHVEVIVTASETYNGSNNWIWQRYATTNGQYYERYRVNAGQWTSWKAPALDQLYPVGSIYQSTNSTNPSTFMGGTWERFGQGRVLVGVNESDSDFNAPNKTGGAKTHTLTVDEMPSHSHGQYVSANSGNQAIRRDWTSDGGSTAYPQGVNTGNTGGNQPHNNLQPFITVYMWRRIA
ncbi:DUF859 family phage minor structural protein [Streptococcus sp. E17BB]|uniref:DUF859 family phage minor structural protein n=1 Tax=Streptococcus sp. E17BB TaxID=3278714 RepID=UPI00359D9244